MNLVQEIGDTLVQLTCFVAAIIIALGISIARFAGVTHPSFQAVAHVYVGLMFGVAIGQQAWYYAYIGIVLCVVEVLAVLILGFHRP